MADDSISRPKRPLAVVRAGEQRVSPVEQGARGRAPAGPAAESAARRLVLWFAPVARNLPAALLAVTGPTGCYLSHRLSEEDAGRNVDAGRTPDGGPPPPLDAGPAWCPPFAGGLQIVTVPLPPPGVPAEPAPVCMTPGMIVESAMGARITLAIDGSGTVRGTLTLAPSLVDRVVGEPRVTVVSSGIPGAPPTIGPLAAAGDGTFSFELTFPDGLFIGFDPLMLLTLETRFEIDCRGPEPDAGMDLRTVSATSFLALCQEDPDGRLVFVSAGEECKTCAIIAEMAPTPIIPSEQPDGLPLQQGMALKLRALARFDGAVVLWAEHGQGTDGAALHWQTSAGELHPLASDVVVWVLPEDTRVPHLAQVVVETRDAAAVATLRIGAGL